MAEYKIPHFEIEGNQGQLREAIDSIRRQFTKECARMELELEQQTNETAAKLTGFMSERSHRGRTGKHVTIELMDGKHDGMILDSQSNDQAERELVKFLRYSSAFEQIQVVESDTEAFMQLRPKNKPIESSQSP